MNIQRLILLILFFPLWIYAIEDLTIDLQNPRFCGGVLTTTEGGVITGEGLRIQAQTLEYTKQEETGVWKLVAEGDLICEYGNYLFVGERIDYDFVAREGVITQGRSAIEPWHFGGDYIYLHADNSVEIVNGFLTTSENICPEWEIKTDFTTIDPCHNLSAQDVRFRLFDTPVFWVPRFSTNLDMILESPIHYRVRWGGEQGFRLGMNYDIFTWRKVVTSLRFDYRFERGPGGGFENHYESHDHKKRFHTVNYIANDSSIDNPGQKTRYRFEGLYENYWDEGRTKLSLSYDWLSDEQMPTDYQDKGLVIKDAEKTQVNFRKQVEELWVTNFDTRVRLNDFQTVKQELPSYEVITKPLAIGSTGIVADGLIRLGHLDFVYDNTVHDVSDYNSTRLEFRQRVYRPCRLGIFTATPEAGAIAIFYNNTPIHQPQWVTVGDFGCEVKTDFYRIYDTIKHVAEPYVKYQYLTFPDSTPNDHYIFDINDGWYRLNTMRMGLRNFILRRNNCAQVSPLLNLDLFAYAFFNTETLPQCVPRLYQYLEFNPTLFMKNVITTGWNIQENVFDYGNFRTEVTVDDNLAFSFEYRYRGPFAWRKAVAYNFILESFRTQEELEHSLLSDRRKTLLANVFYRFKPNWAAQFQIRHGWDRKYERGYTEYQADLLVQLRAHWQMRMAYENRENDHRVAVYFTLGSKTP